MPHPVPAAKPQVRYLIRPSRRDRQPVPPRTTCGHPVPGATPYQGPTHATTRTLPADSLIVRHGPIYDHFAHRWCLKAHLPDGAPATTIFDLSPDLRTALIHPAAIPTYSIALITRDTQHLADVCRSSGQTATFTNPGITLTASHTPDGITMTSTAHHEQLTLTYRHHTAAALAIVTAELRDMLPVHHKAAS